MVLASACLSDWVLSFSQRVKDYCTKQMKLVLESTLILVYCREKISTVY